MCLCMFEIYSKVYQISDVDAGEPNGRDNRGDRYNIREA